MTLVLNGTTGVSAVDGSAATPAIQGNDSNTGMFFPAADTIAFAEGGAEVARFDSSGNLGIGTGTPSTKLHVQGNARSANSGNTVYTELQNDGVYATGTDLYLLAPSGKFLAMYAGNAERARIDSSGNLLVGTTSTAQGASVGNKFIGTGAVWVVNAATNDAFSYYNTSAAAYRFYVNSGGTISATSTTISAISDQRLKENVQDLDVGLNAVMALKPRKFDWKPGKGKDIKGDRGWIAQEFEQVFPDMIDIWKDKAPEGEEPYKSVRADLIPVLVKAIQEQQALIAALQADVAALKGQA